MTMSLKQQIFEAIGNSPTSVQELYCKFPDKPKTTVRGRLYNLLGKEVKRIGKGLYISQNAIVEHGNALEIIDQLLEEGDKFDFIFLDIPYQAPGQKGGNRNLSNFNVITPDQFIEFLPKCEALLRNESSFICFMFTSGKSSASVFNKYHSAFGNTSLRLAAQGSYEKLWANGNPMNMGKHKMPEEYIMLYNKTGLLEMPQMIPLYFSLTPDFEYPTSKPYPMIKKLVETFTKKLDWVLDPFAGSGKIVRACEELGRHCHVIDISEESINKFILPQIQ